MFAKNGQKKGSSCIKITVCSLGDQSPFFYKCISKCIDKHCLNYDGLEFRMKYPRPFYLDLLRWTCGDDCNYECMWQTVNGFEERGYRIPQFFGKWPFIRFLGMQEPASTIFSLVNLYAHVRMMIRMQTELRPDTPLKWLWLGYGVVSCHAWIWSAIFHSRDLPFTEMMDYSCAYSIVLTSCYTMLMRILRKFWKLNLVITFLFLTFFLDHVRYIMQGGFDYSYNMKVNVATGLLTVICWLLWSFWNCRKLQYVWKIRAYVILVALTTSLELWDLPPLFWTFDCHAIWHLSTAPLHVLFYSFIIDDCKYLRNEDMKYEKFQEIE
ncbi:per1-related [Holotrichia oblita]|uniref:Per1-related n=1 Tax=Holotrichia oblita TaxID=644536 RepID=A0ACB9T4V6_HOLOL|nr:per1-related [Holotrichia oblita]